VSYRALYRVWRPQTFKDLIGQDHVTTTLKNALKEGHFSHAYLFSGPRGTGKTSAAKLMAKAVNCVHGPTPEPCNTCDACRKITEGSLMDVVEIDAASNRGVDEIRDLRDKVKYAPTEVRYKVYIVDEVHMLTPEAFNALLKTLEEPPEHVMFILATTEPHKLPSTIISRCQRFSFRRHTLNNILDHLKKICVDQGIEAEEAALVAIAQAADGGMRDALSLLDQVLAFSDRQVDEAAVLAVTGSVSRSTLGGLMKSCLEGEAPRALETVNGLLMDGLDPERLVHDLIQLSRDLLLLTAAPELEEVKQWIASEQEWVHLGQQASSAWLEQALDTLIHAQQQMKWAPHPRVVLEMTLVRLCRGERQAPSAKEAVDLAAVDRLQEQLHRLQKQVEGLKAQRRPVQLEATPSAAEPKKSQVKKESAPRRVSAKVAGLDLFLHEGSPERLRQVTQGWPDVLARVKEQKITVHAWLIDGEPVAATENQVLVAFKNTIHRETTEKEANKSLIEQVIREVLGFPMRLVTVMRADWESRRASSETSVTEEEPPSQTSGVSSSSDNSEDPVERAVELFGTDIVEITD